MLFRSVQGSSIDCGVFFRFRTTYVSRIDQVDVSLVRQHGATVPSRIGGPRVKEGLCEGATERNAAL